MSFRPGPIDSVALYSVMFQSAGVENRAGPEQLGARQPGYINLRTLAVVYLTPEPDEPQTWFGQPVPSEQALARAQVGENPDQWLPVPVWTGNVGDHAGGEAFVREFVELLINRFETVANETVRDIRNQFNL